MTIIAFNRYWVIRWQWVVVNLMLVAILLGLSVWQLWRADEKEALLSRIESAEQRGAIDATQLLSVEGSNADGLSVRFHGRWLSPFIWLLDNRTLNGQIGYDVLVPIQTSVSTSVLLVNLGWLAAPVYRDVLPSVEIPRELEIDGIVRTRVGGLLLGKNQEDKDTWPARIQQVDFQQIESKLPNSVYPAVIYQQIKSPFITHYHPVVMSPQRHKAYALQWALLALAVIGVALAASMRKEATGE